jgi:hypothetical protein
MSGNKNSGKRGRILSRFKSTCGYEGAVSPLVADDGDPRGWHFIAPHVWSLGFTGPVRHAHGTLKIDPNRPFPRGTLNGRVGWKAAIRSTH